MMFEIGILFDIDALGGGFYGYEAWKIFMRHCKGESLAGTTLFEGDTAETLSGQVNHFCIAVFALEQSKVAYVKEVMSRATDKGLLPLGERFIEGRVTRMTGGHQPLPQRARVDAFGRFVTDKWTRIDEELCEKTGWIYALASVDSTKQATLEKTQKTTDPKRDFATRPLPKIKTTRGSNFVRTIGMIAGFYFGIWFSLSSIIFVSNEIITSMSLLLSGMLNIISIPFFRKRENKKGGILLITGLIIAAITFILTYP